LNIGQIQKKYFIHNWGIQKDYNPIEVERTEGCWIFTKDGRKIFDLRSAHECINLGFNNKRVIEAIKRQIEKVIYVTDDFATEPSAFLAKKLCEMVPGGENKKVWFGQSGAAAVETAIKAARNYKIRSSHENLNYINQFPYKIISRYKSWHGSLSGALSASGDPRRWFNEPFNVPGVVFAPEAYCSLNHTYPECDLACADYVENIIENEGGKNRVAAVILETIVGSNGIIPPPDGYFKRLNEILDKYDILLVVDETVTGMGRTGKMFAFEHYNLEPDIVIIGKALGAYCPITAVIFSERIAESFNDFVFIQGQSFSGHALASAAALESINVLEEEILPVLKQKERYLFALLSALEKKHNSVGEIRGKGLFWTIELKSNDKYPVRKPTEKYRESIITIIAQYLLNEKNIYIPKDKFGIWIVPPLIVTYDEMEYIVESIDDALDIADKLLINS
jgi:taurine--2-oxoglutarate transaminase